MLRKGPARCGREAGLFLAVEVVDLVPSASIGQVHPDFFNFKSAHLGDCFRSCRAAFLLDLVDSTKDILHSRIRWRHPEPPLVGSCSSEPTALVTTNEHYQEDYSMSRPLCVNLQ